MKVVLTLNKLSHHNPLEVLCVPTCIKNIVDNQFNNINLSRSLINKWCYFRGNTQDILGLDALEEYFAPKLLKNKNLAFQQLQPGRLIDITKLIEQKIFPVIVFKLEDYNKWKTNTHIEVEIAGSTTYHAMLVCGFDSDKEIIYLYDPLYDRYNKDKYKSQNQADIYDKLSYLKFSQFWDKGFNSFMFWLEESKSIKTKKAAHKTLDQY